MPLYRSSGSAAAATVASTTFGCAKLCAAAAGGAHFPKTVKEELEQGFNALVVESRLLLSASMLRGGRGAVWQNTAR